MCVHIGVCVRVSKCVSLLHSILSSLPSTCNKEIALFITIMMPIKKYVTQVARFSAKW